MTKETPRPARIPLVAPLLLAAAWARASSGGFDTVLVVPAAGDQKYAIGHLLVDGNPATDEELLKRVAIRDGAACK